LGSHRVYIHGIHQIKSFVSKGVTWNNALFETLLVEINVGKASLDICS